MPERQLAIPIEDEMRRSYLDYAMSVIIGRALPDIRDGLKPVHRRVLYAMHEMGLAWNRGYRKSARVVGDTLGKFHPHGEAPVYEALVRMAQEFSLRLSPRGRPGQLRLRSTGTRRRRSATPRCGSRRSRRRCWRTSTGTPSTSSDYDETQQEPVVLPARLPNLLVNGSSGIAVGMATNIPPHNLGRDRSTGSSSCSRTRRRTVEELLRVVKGPDFPTRGYIYGTAGIRDAFTTGRGIITMRARAHREAPRWARGHRGDRLPYQVNKASLMTKIAELSRGGTFDGLSEIRDESDRHGIRMVLELGKGEIAQIVLNQLYKHTAMQSTFGVNMLALIGRRPQVVTLREMLDHFIDFRREVVVRRTRYDLARAEERAHILEGLRKALDHLDLVIRLIRAARERRRRPAGLDEPAGAQRDPGEGHPGHAAPAPDAARAREGGPGAHRGAPAHRAAARDPRLRRPRAAIIKEGAGRPPDGVRRRAPDRDRRGDGRAHLEDLIADEEMVVTVTRSGYIKRTAIEAYRSQRRGGKGVTGMETKEEDVVENVYIASTHAYLPVLHERRARSTG